ncbi:MAG: peptide chain release factor N(5)-glutamine methyltransferase [Flavobacteriaceae bacterium]|nr:peptide chain release factor N(5)-glutamine methyltransferase [Flavobacteriaceae bacterium]MCY4267252.1 peptide chain release factor N(5)-glutamine methyltransferase [Flavobacteriaceae bacterium]MCY4299521.1 peptide chain release factor N(5)-glutamine methyltransferase [Flavobacteriaceae bacterium]
MTLIELKNWFVQMLNQKYPRREIDFYFNQLMEHFTTFDSIDLALRPNQIIPKKNLTFLKEATIELLEFRPLQYISGETVFLERTFKVNKHVMIPRPETEELVQWIQADYQSSKNIRVMDMGTGSGCIAISLSLENPTWNISGCDIHKDIIKIARQNAKDLNANTNFFYFDIIQYTPTQKDFKVNVIVSNPPYVTHGEKKEMLPNVLNWEPHSALFVSNDNPLIFYRKIATYGLQNLKPNGKLYFEINPKFHREIKDLLNNFNYTDIVFKKDTFDRIRMVRATKEQIDSEGA